MLTVNEIIWPHSWCQSVYLSTGMSSTLCKRSILKKTFKQLLNLVLHWGILCCSASMGDCFDDSSECNYFLGCHAALLCRAFRKGMEFPVSQAELRVSHVPIQKTRCCSGAHALPIWQSAAWTLSAAGLGPLGGVLSARLMSLGQVLRAGSVWYVTTLPPALLSLSQSHAEAASSANKTWRHQVVCIIRLMTASMSDFIDSSFQSNTGALLEHSTVWQ